MSAGYVKGAADPDLAVSWIDDDGLPIDFSSGYSFTLKIWRKGATPVVTKTTGIVGAPTLPNVIVTWAAGELDIATGGYELEIKATKSGRDRYLTGTLEIKARAA